MVKKLTALAVVVMAALAVYTPAQAQDASEGQYETPESPRTGSETVPVDFQLTVTGEVSEGSVLYMDFLPNGQAPAAVFCATDGRAGTLECAVGQTYSHTLEVSAGEPTRFEYYAQAPDR